MAAQIFHQKGFHATSLQDIATEVGMLKGSLYYYISSKDDLLFEIMLTAHQAFLGYMADIFQSTDPADRRLHEFLKRHVAYSLTHQSWTAVYQHEYKSLPKQQRGKIAKLRDRYERQVVAILNQGKADGVFRSDVDTSLAVKAMLGMANWSYHWYSPGGPLSPDQIGETFANLALDGFRWRDRSPRNTGEDHSPKGVLRRDRKRAS